MFGGLSIKGEFKEAPPPPSSSFISSSSSSTSAVVGSAFSFLQSTGGGPDVGASSSAAAGAASVVPDHMGNAVTVVPPTPPPPPQAAADEDDNGGGLAMMGSAFDFLTSAALTTTTASAASEGGAKTTTIGGGGGGGGSGFSFIPSSPSRPSTDDGASSSSSFGFLVGGGAAAAEGSRPANDGTSSSSSFGFLVGDGAVGGGSVGGGTPSSPVDPPSLVAAVGGASGFSFLSGVGDDGAATVTTTTTNYGPPPSVSSPTINVTMVPQSSAAIAWSTPTLPPSPQRPADLLSQLNGGGPQPSWSSMSAMPVASMMGGASGGGPVVAPKKVVKKKRGKRVGVASSASAGGDVIDIPDPEDDENVARRAVVPESDVGSAWGNVGASDHAPSSSSSSSFACPSTPGPPSIIAPPDQPPYVEESPPMRIKAERAMDKAEEFIREKQMRHRIAISSAAERAMQHRGGGSAGGMGGSGSGGPWKMTNDVAPAPVNTSTSDIPSLMPSNSRDETYQAAKAAAEEARKLADHSKGSKASLFGNFFHRKIGGGIVGGGSTNHEISSYSSHGGVIGSALSSTRDVVLRRGESGGSSSSGGGAGERFAPPPPPTVEIPDGHDNAIRENNDEEEVKRRDFQSELERQRKTDLERRKLAERRRAEEERAAAAAKLSLEAERLRRAEEEERAERQRLEAEKRRAPREKMRSALDRLAASARASTDEVERLREARAALVERRAAAYLSERYAAQRAKFAEAQQAIAVEEEDFESADRLGGVIEMHSKEREEQSSIRRSVQSAIAELDRDREAAAMAVAACFGEARTKLAELRDEVDDLSKEEEMQSQLASTSKKLSSESERLGNDLKNIERDENVLAEEQKELDEQISGEAKEFEEKCKEASAKLEVVNKTIADLRKQLAEAEAEGFDLNMEIKSYNQSIDNVRSKYSRQLGRLEKKSQSVKESRADWTSEKESIEKAKIAHEAVVAAHSEEMVAREKIINEIKVECAAAKELEEIVTRAFEKVDTDEISNREGEDYGSVDAEVLKYEAVLNEANQNVLLAEANISNLQEELSNIEVRVPILEAEKKNAASKRDFKAASQASKEIKDALARKEQCEGELAGEAMERKRVAKNDFEKVSALLEEKKKIAEQRERDFGLKQMTCLREKATDLKLMLEKFSSLGGDDSEDDYMNVSLVGAFVISSQILVLEAEMKALGEKYGVVEAASDDEIVENLSVHSGPSFESTEDVPETKVDASIVERYNALKTEMKDLEDAINDAVKEENFDKAADLSEKARSIRDEFENSGFALKEFEEALRNFVGKTSSDGGDAEDKIVVSSNELIDEGVLQKYASLCSDIQGFEAMIEEAVENESFDLAAELDEKVHAARSCIEALGFSLDELEEAAKKRSVAVQSNEIQHEGGEQFEDLKMSDDAETREENISGIVDTDAEGEDGYMSC